MRKKLDDEYWARAEAADRADNSLVGYESPAECDQGSVERPQHTFEIRTLSGSVLALRLPLTELVHLSFERLSRTL